MENQEILSVIVPIYNVEKYVVKCIKSIIDQTYTNLQVILVDDGSTDKSGIICDKLSRMDNRIQVVHKKNGGLSSARNCGIDFARGKYICFIDSDDWIDINMFKNLINCMEANNADIVVCNYLETDNENYNYKNSEKYKVCEFTNIEAMNCLYEKDYSRQMVVVWNKIYKRDLFNEVRFPNGKIHEDEFVNYRLYYYSNKVVYMSSVYYYYRINMNSITHCKYNVNRLHALEAMDERLQFAQKINNIKFYNNTLKAYCYICINSLINCKKYLKENKLLINSVKARTSCIINKYIANNSIKINKNEKFKLKILKKSVLLYRIINKMEYVIHFKNKNV